jgi:predicted secreted protein
LQFQLIKRDIIPLWFKMTRKRIRATVWVPTSRGCPQGYSVAGAVAFGDQVTLILKVKTFGFEGSDLSLINVPFRLSSVVE